MQFNLVWSRSLILQTGQQQLLIVILHVFLLMVLQHCGIVARLLSGESDTSTQLQAVQL